MNQWHYNKIKQLKDWRSDLNAVLVFAKTDEETRKDTFRYISLLDYAIKQAERVQELEDKLARIRFVNNDYDKQNKRYREALEFYADEETYEPPEVQVGAVTKEGYKILKYKYNPIINTDKGKKARKALEGEK